MRRRSLALAGDGPAAEDGGLSRWRSVVRGVTPRMLEPMGIGQARVWQRSAAPPRRAILRAVSVIRSLEQGYGSHLADRCRVASQRARMGHREAIESGTNVERVL